MSNLNTPAIYTGPLTVAELNQRLNPGRIYRTEDGEYLMPAEACTEVGQEDEQEDFGAFYGLKSAVLITAGIACIAIGVHLLVQAIPHIF